MKIILTLVSVKVSKNIKIQKKYMKNQNLKIQNQ